MEEVQQLMESLGTGSFYAADFDPLLLALG